MSSLDYYTITVIVLTSIILFLEVYSGYKEDKEMKKAKENEKKYVLNVVTFHEDGGVSSHWHGWSDKWIFNHEEALEKIKQLEELKLFDEIEMLEYETEQEKVSKEVNYALKSSINE